MSPGGPAVQHGGPQPLAAAGQGCGPTLAPALALLPTPACRDGGDRVFFPPVRGMQEAFAAMS